MSARQASLFRNGNNQAIRIPKEFELEGTQAIIRKEGNRLIIEPVPSTGRLLQLLDTLSPIDEAFPEIEDLPPEDSGPFS